MNSNVKFNVFLIPVFFIVIYTKIRSVQGGLESDENLSRAAFCLRKFLGEDVVPTSFLNKDDDLSNGEYFGALCKIVSPDNIDNIIEKAKENNQDTDIKKCLAESNSENIFELYSSKSSLEDTDTTPNQHNLPPNSEKIQETPINEEQILSNFKIKRFILGTCGCRLDNNMDFDKLETEADKTEKFECLALCTDTLMYRIEHISTIEKKETIRLIEIKIKELKHAPSLKSINNKTVHKQIQREEKRIITYQNKIVELNNAKYYSNEGSLRPAFYGIVLYDSIGKQKSIEIITTRAEEYLNNYADFYNEMDECTTIDGRYPYIKLDNMNTNLTSTYSLYENCVEQNCGMNDNSNPLRDLMEAEIKRQNSDTSNPGALQIVTDKLAQIGILKKYNREKFYRILFGLQNLNNQSN